MTSPRYDVFVSYSRDDVQVAREVTNGLRAAGFKVWFDLDVIRPGDPWMLKLDRGIAQSDATVMLIGADGLTPWTKTEGQQALREAIESGHRVIPVLLPWGPSDAAAMESLPFLKQYHFLNCRELPVSTHIVEQVVVAITGRKLISQISQIGSEFALTLPRPNGTARTIRVYTLPNPERNSLLWLTWQTFGACTEKLANQIANYGWRVNADVCVGINDAGLVMATFLGSNVLERPKLGYLRCKGTGTKADASFFMDGCFLPDAHEAPTILLVDFELKTGKGLSEVCKKLRETYEEPSIYLAICGVMVQSDDLTIDRIDELESFSHLQENGVLDLFVAATMANPGIEPPLGLR